ncbi:DUF4365 domain-containing protein [Cystobacter fuscus]|uniref:DUF4365 domain-containing protein n=1 Tax=Cystobacter fuscus TaxID=43 RepID=UPI002B2A383D|nr:DUF4365 domain-containing protein [Cystobacter fuscus]
MQLNDRKEQFSIAYVHAVASAAGVITSPMNHVDRLSVDIKLTGMPPAYPRCPEVNVQLKCTSNFELDEHDFGFPLPIKNYDDLRDDNLSVPRILIVLLVPKNIQDWLDIDESRMLARNCAYWHSLRGELPTTNKETVTVRVPRKNVTVHRLKQRA